jgi:MFS family permease
VLSVGEVGGLLGALAATRVMIRLGVGPAILASGAIFAPSLMVLAVAPSELAFLFLAAGWVTMSFADVVYNTTTVSLRQAYVPQRLQGRVVGFNRAIVWGVSPLGARSAVYSERSSVCGGALAAGALVCLLALIPALLSPVRQLRDLPEPMEADGIPERLPVSLT